MNKACDKAKIERCGFHTLRKSVGAHRVMRGVQLSYVAELLGHKSIRVTERHYGHLVEITSRKPYRHPCRLLGSKGKGI
jgi:integrase